MPDTLDLDSIAAQMTAAAERAIATPAEPDRRHADWQKALVPDLPILSARTDLTGARVVASNPAHILAILAERDSLRALLAKAEGAGAELLASHEDLFRYKPVPKGPYTVKIPSDEQLRHGKAMHDFRAVLGEIRKARP